jgi:hypothetical protein
MPFGPPHNKSVSQARSALAGLMLGLWMVTAVVTACPDLHGLLHRDSQGPDHYCLFTQLNHHVLLVSFAAVLTPEPPAVIVPTHVFSAGESVVSVEYLVSDGRAPPAPVPSSPVVG